MEQLRHDINAKIDDVLKAHEGKEIVISVEKINAPAFVSSYSGDFVHGIDYKMRLTALLLNYKDAEIGDCVYADGVVAALGSNTARMGECTFVWEGKWWRRVE